MGKRRGTFKSDPIVLFDDSDDEAAQVSRFRKPAAAAASSASSSYNKSNSNRPLNGFYQTGTSSYVLAGEEKKDEGDIIFVGEKKTRHDHAEDLARLAYQYQRADPQQEHDMMKSSSDGKSVLAVQRILGLVQSFKNSNPGLGQYVDAVAFDDMVFIAKRMLDLQSKFISSNVNGFIDVGYHYTNDENLNQIRTNGLLSKLERQSQNVVSRRANGSVFGDGIYTANNPKSFLNFGPVGLLVGRLQGKAIRVSQSLMRSAQIDANTVIGDKTAHRSNMRTRETTMQDSDGWPKADTFHEIVLSSSSQCLPMVKYRRELLQQNGGEYCLKLLEQSLQTILDQILNEGLQRPFSMPPLINNSLAGSSQPGRRVVVSTASNSLNFSNSSNLANNQQLMSLTPSGPIAINVATSNQGLSIALNQHRGHSLRSKTVPVKKTTRPAKKVTTAPRKKVATSKKKASRILPPPATYTPATLSYTAPTSLVNGIQPGTLKNPPISQDMSQECAICLDSLSCSACSALTVCSHVFHTRCVQEAFKRKPQCPTCRKAVSAPQGKSPSGTMNVTFDSSKCAGFQKNTIQITYAIHSGHQMNYHDNPGQFQGGKHVVAYLPNNIDGQQLLKRLKYAFMHGLTFTVGTSMTTGIPNQCTWASIHHKTSRVGGVAAHGFPDPTYFVNCNGELDSLGVPAAHMLRDDGSEI